MSGLLYLLTYLLDLYIFICFIADFLGHHDTAYHIRQIQQAGYNQMNSDLNQEAKPQTTKNDNQKNHQRQFGCPCGKTYLSFPALYTHVKTKHDGKAPGDITKPKTQKTRGRPRNIIVETPVDDSQCPFDLADEINKVIENVNISYEGQFETSQGTVTCQDMASKFLAELLQHSPNSIQIVKCYLNQMREFIQVKQGDKYWREEPPQQIIDMTNQMQQEHEKKKQKSPISKQIFIELTYLLFKWMYRNNWTSHKLMKRNSVQIQS